MKKELKDQSNEMTNDDMDEWNNFDVMNDDILNFGHQRGTIDQNQVFWVKIQWWLLLLKY